MNEALDRAKKVAENVLNLINDGKEELVTSFEDIIFLNRPIDMLILFLTLNIFFVLANSLRYHKAARMTIMIIFILFYESIWKYFSLFIYHFLIRKNIDYSSFEPVPSINSVSSVFGTIYYFIDISISPIYDSLAERDGVRCFLVIFSLLTLFYFFWSIDTFHAIWAIANIVLFAPLLANTFC